MGCSCRALSPAVAAERVKAGERHVIRLRMEPIPYTLEDSLRGTIQIAGNAVDDPVLLKSDGFPTYHLASVVDDHCMQISTVIRGEEWISSSPKHIALYKAFHWEMPAFMHLPLILSEKKTKISKRNGGFDVATKLREGYLPSALLNYMYYLGLKRGNDAEQTDTGIFFDLPRMVADVGLFLRVDGSSTCRS